MAMFHVFPTMLDVMEKMGLFMWQQLSLEMIRWARL